MTDLERIAIIEKAISDLRDAIVIVKDDIKQEQNRNYLEFGNIRLNLRNIASMTNTPWIDKSVFDPTSHK